MVVGSGLKEHLSLRTISITSWMSEVLYLFLQDIGSQCIKIKNYDFVFIIGKNSLNSLDDVIRMKIELRIIENDRGFQGVEPLRRMPSTNCEIVF